MLWDEIPDFFGEEDEAALRSQVDWLDEHVGLGEEFFSRLLRTDRREFADWRKHRAELSPEQQEVLREFWRTFLHILDFTGWDEGKIRTMLDFPVPADARAMRVELLPAWRGSTMKAYMLDGGYSALAEVDRWVTAFGAGDPFRD